jgi:hypothetical protein
MKRGVRPRRRELLYACFSSSWDKAVRIRCLEQRLLNLLSLSAPDPFVPLQIIQLRL